jgi:hypothetical protein
VGRGGGYRRSLLVLGRPHACAYHVAAAARSTGPPWRCNDPRLYCVLFPGSAASVYHRMVST